MANAATLIIPEDTATNLVLSASDVDGDSLSFQLVTAPSNGIVSGSAPELVFSPAADFHGTSSFSFVAVDGSSTSAPVAMTLVISPVNDIPVAEAQSVTLDEDTPQGITLRGTDVDGDALTYTVTVQPTNGTLSGAGQDLVYTPDANFAGTDTFTYQVNDGLTNSVPALVTLTIQPVNDAPSAIGQDLSINEDSALHIVLAGNDVENDSLIFSMVTQPIHGTLSGAPPELTYTPVANYHGPDSFTFTANDGDTNSEPVTINLSVISVNDVPVASSMTLETDEETPVPFTLTGSDIDEDGLAYLIEVSPAHGTLSGVAPNLTYTPVSGYFGPDSFTFKASDGTAVSEPATVSITVRRINRAPIVSAGMDQTNSSLQAQLSGAVTDDGLPNGADIALSWSQVSGPGTVTFSDASAPNSLASFSESGIYVLRLSASDSKLESSDEVLIVVNAGPIVDAGPDQTLEISQPLVLHGSVSDDGLPFGQLSTVWTVTGPGPVVFTNINSLENTVAVSGPGTYVFTLTATDFLSTNSDEAVITVTPVNLAPMVAIGPKQLVFLPESATLLAFVRDDGLPLGSNLEFQWTKLSGPGEVVFADPTSTNTTANFSAPGDYVLRLSASDSTLSGYSDVNIAVRNPAMNQTPIVSAGGNLVIGLTNIATLRGSATDDGLPLGSSLSFQWSVVSGPGAVNFADPGATNISATFEAVGTYLLRLTASDSQMSASNDVMVTVHPFNQAPIVMAGDDQTVTVPDPVLLSATTGEPLDPEIALQTSLGSEPRWNHTVGQPGLTGPVDEKALSYADGILYAGGTFGYLGELKGSPAEDPIRRWDGTNWTGLYSNEPTSPGAPAYGYLTIYSGASIRLAARGKELFVQGGFIRDLRDDGLNDWTARWDGTTWRPWEVQVASPVVTYGQLLTAPDLVYLAAGMSFRPTNSAGSINLFPELPKYEAIATWDGMNWGTVGSNGLAGQALCAVLSPDRTKLYVGGFFHYPTPTGVATNIVMWDGNQWAPLGGGLMRASTDIYGQPIDATQVRSLAVDANGNLYAAGSITVADGNVPVRNVARWDGTNWSAMGSGLESDVFALAVRGRDVFAGGMFSTAGGKPARRIARWNGFEWRPLRTGNTNGVNAFVWSLEAVPEGIYVAGDFTEAGGTPVNYISLWEYPTEPQKGVQLTGQVIDDGLPNGQLSVCWSKVSGPGTPTFVNSNSAVTSVTFDQVGTYVLRLSANDSEFTTLDEVTITLQGNQPPVVNAGTDQIQGLSESVVLQGCVTDDGLPVGDNLMWTWSVVNGPGQVTFGNQSITNTTARFSQTGIYILRLTANDMQFTVQDEVRIVVTGDNQVPGAHPGSSRTVLFGASTNLSPALLRDDGLPIQVTNVLWSQISGPGIVSFGNPTNPVTPVSFSLPGVYVIRLNVNDSELTTFMDTTWTVILGQNSGPTIEAGPNQSLTSLSVLLTGSVTDDGLPANAPLSIWWSKSSGPGTVTFVDSNSPVTWATFSKPGSYALLLNASDTTVSRYDYVSFQMPNQKPVVNAGPDCTVLQPAMSLSLAGSATDDGQYYPTTTPSWAKVSGPGTATFSPANALNTTVTFSAAGTYVLRLSVSDGGLIGTDEIAVVVAPPGNQPPAVTAGTDLASTWPATNLTLSGSVTDDGLPAGTVQTTWTQVSGPASATFSDPSVSSPQVAFPAPGTYTLRLMANDSVLTNGDDVVVQILPPANLPPVVSIGSDQVLQLPETLALAANVSDDGWPAGGSVQWFWRKISGPGPIYFPGSTNLTTNLNPTAQFTVPGDYVLRFTASDSASSTSADLNVTVLPSDPNQRPVVFAGPDQVATQYSPFTLAGNITDDGLPTNGFASVAWSKLSGPGNIYFGNAAALKTTAAFYLPGTYVLRLTASDGRATGFDDLSINVVQPVNDPPLADAGPDLQITRPEPAALEGAVYDDRLPAGYPLSYEWTVVSGPGTVTFVGGSGTADYIFLNTLAYFSTNGTYVLRLTAGDSEFTHSDEVTITVLAGINFAPIVHAGPDFAASLTSPAVLHTEVTDDGLESGILQVSWSQVSGPGSAHFSTVNGVYQATFNTAGDYTLRLTAHDGSLTNSDDVTISVMDATSPVAEISRPIDGSTITAPAEIIGTAQSPILKDYVVEYRLTPATDLADIESAEAAWSVLASNSVSVTSNALAVFDPTLLLNGIYEVRLTATDVVGRSTTSEPISVIVDRNLKIGHFTISFNDLTLPVPGLPIQVTRTYDSRAAAAGLQGDFGLGWTLDIKNVRLQKNRSLSRNWTQTTTGDPYSLSLAYHLDGGKPRIVTVTFPEGRVEKFQFVPKPMDQALLPIEYPQWRFIPMGNTRGTLVPASYDDPDGNFLYFAGSIPGTADLYDLNHFSDWLFGGGPIEELQRYPTLFRYSNPEGYHYLIDEIAGLQSVTDPNGNTLLIGTNGVSWTNSVSGGTNSLTVAFQRDDQGRITNIVDAAGNALRYSYNTAGDLAAFTDRSGSTNGFAYTNAAFPHHLTGITDARGVMPMSNEYDATGRLVANTDVYGNTIQYVNDIANLRSGVVDRNGNQISQEFDTDGNLVRAMDALGGVTTFTYDDQGRRLSRTNPLGETETYAYNATNGALIAVVNALGETNTFAYNASGQVTEATERDGTPLFAEYDDANNVTRIVDALGNPTVYAYNSAGKAIYSRDALGNEVHSAYDQFGNLLRATNALGNVSEFSYDANNRITQQILTRTTNGITQRLTNSWNYDSAGRVVTAVAPDGTFSQTIYDAAGHMAATIDELGRATTNRYDLLGRLIEVVYPDGTTEGYAYDAGDRKIATTNRLGQVTRYFYDALNRPVITLLPDGSGTTNYYDAGSRLIAATDARGNSTWFGYDALGRTIAITNALGQVSTFSYDARGNQITSTDSLGRTTTNVYDLANRLLEVHFPDGSWSATAYDALGRTVSNTDQATNTTWYGYDALGRLLAVTNALNQVTRYEYNELGEQTAQIDASGRLTRYEYDTRGRRTSRILPLGQADLAGYDLAGNLTSYRDFNGNTTAYQYDLQNRLLLKTPDSRLGEPGVSFGYNALGQRTNMVDASGATTYRYDERNRLVEKSTPQGILTYTYDANGNVTSIQSSNTNGVAVTYEYDALNRLSAVNDSNLGRTAYSYDAAGNLAVFTYPNLVHHEYAYDALNRLTNVAGSHLVNSLASYAYTLAANGQRTSVTESRGRVVNYAYDLLNRLTNETVSGVINPGSASYTYDAVGNRLARNSNLPGILASSYAYDANDRLLSDAYDDNGNTRGASMVDPVSLVSQPVSDQYDFENRLVRRTTTIDSQPATITCVYDGDGNRVRKTIATATNTVTTYYLVDDLNPTGYPQVLEEHVSFNLQPATLNRVYTYGHSLISQDRLDIGGWAESYYGYDGQGSVRYLVDRNGVITDTYDFDAFGNLIGRTGQTPNNYLYQGEQFDSDLKLYYLRARYADPDRGRFWTQDSFEGFGTDPQSLHKYTFNHNNPVNRRDPSGHVSLGETMNVVVQAPVVRGALLALQRQFVTCRIQSALVAGATGGAIGAAVGGVIETIAQSITGQYDPFKVLEAEVQGAAVGALEASLFVMSPGAFCFYSGLTTIQAGLEFTYVLKDPTASMFDKYVAATSLLMNGLPLISPKLARRLSAALKTMCFPAGTEVATAEGQKPIEQVREGDLVWAQDDRTGEISLKRVKQLFVNTAAALVVLHCGTNTLEATPEHPLWVAGAGWKAAGQIQVGDGLWTRSGEPVPVTSISHKQGQFTVYNFEVEDAHSYFVGERQLLGHNACDRWQFYQNKIASLYKGYTSAPVRWIDGNGDLHIADNVAIINGRRTAIEAKLLQGPWNDSLRNPGSKSGRMVFGVEEQNKMLNQAKAYASQFDDVIYHSNSQALIDHYSALFRANGISNVKWVLTYE